MPSRGGEEILSPRTAPQEAPFKRKDGINISSDKQRLRVFADSIYEIKSTQRNKQYHTKYIRQQDKHCVGPFLTALKIVETQ